MLFESSYYDNLSLVHDSAIEDIKKHIETMKKRGENLKDPEIGKLCENLDYYFNEMVEWVYQSTMDAHTRRKLEEAQNQNWVADYIFYGVEENISSRQTLCPEKYKYLYPYPIDHLDVALSMTSETAIRVLPYLLTAYYRHPPSSKKVAEGTDQEGFTLINENHFKRDLGSYASRFSFQKMISNFLKQLRSSKKSAIRSLKTRDELIEFLQCNSELTSLHYNKLLLSLIYCMCVFCCTRVPALSDKIDYALSAELFNEHTLAFESKICRRRPVLS